MKGENNPMFNQPVPQEKREKVSASLTNRNVKPVANIKGSLSNMERFEKQNPINRQKFEQMVKKNASLQELKQEFGLTRSQVYTWTDHIYGTRSISQATEIANKRAPRIIPKYNQTTFEIKSDKEIQEYLKKFNLNRTIMDSELKKNQSINKICKKLGFSKSVLYGYIHITYGTNSKTKVYEILNNKNTNTNIP